MPSKVHATCYHVTALFSRHIKSGLLLDLAATTVLRVDAKGHQNILVSMFRITAKSHKKTNKDAKSLPKATKSILARMLKITEKSHKNILTGIPTTQTVHQAVPLADPQQLVCKYRLALEHRLVEYYSPCIQHLLQGFRIR